MIYSFAVFVALVTSSCAQIDRVELLTGGGCGRATQVPGGVVVSHAPIDQVVPITNDIICLFTIQTFRPRQAARLVFDFVRLSPNNCSRANIEVYDDRYANDSTRLLTPRICPDTDVSSLEYISTGNWMTIRIEADVVSPETPSVNFSASYASFTAKPCVRPDLETECSNVDRCIYNELLCDGVDACGDNTDESEDPPANCEGTSSTTSPPGSSSGSGPILAAILVLAAACLIAYVIYILMSFSWFSEMMYSCLRACFKYALTKRRRSKEEKKKKTKANERSEASSS